MRAAGLSSFFDSAGLDSAGLLVSTATTLLGSAGLDSEEGCCGEEDGEADGEELVAAGSSFFCSVCCFSCGCQKPNTDTDGSCDKEDVGGSYISIRVFGHALANV